METLLDTKTVDKEEENPISISSVNLEDAVEGIESAAKLVESLASALSLYASNMHDEKEDKTAKDRALTRYMPSATAIHGLLEGIRRCVVPLIEFSTLLADA
jgi:hypothetical protein